jgi:hypothetical protein
MSTLTWKMSKATTINDMGVLAKRLYLFDNLIEFASGIKTIEVSGIHKYLYVLGMVP